MERRLRSLGEGDERGTWWVLVKVGLADTGSFVFVWRGGRWINYWSVF